jgi:hypothetical protein
MSSVPKFAATCASLLLLAAFALGQTKPDNTIASVVQRGAFLYVYNAKGGQLSVIAAGGGMTGYTASSVNVRRGNFIYIFDAKGKQTSVIPGARN